MLCQYAEYEIMQIMAMANAVSCNDKNRDISFRLDFLKIGLLHN